MAQAFVSTYQNNYRWDHPEPRPPLHDPEALTRLEPEGDIWLLDGNKALELELRNINKMENAINNLYLKRMKTTYHVSYCKKMKPIKKEPFSLLSKLKRQKSAEDIKKSEVEESQQDFGNELLEYCKNLYEKKTVKITPPLHNATHVYGYMRPSRLLTPHTTYQNEYGRIGYNILKAEAAEENMK